MKTVVKRYVIIEKAPQEVWQALTSAAHLNRWLTDEAEIDLRVGGTFALRAKPAFISGRHQVTAVRAGEHLAFNWMLDGVSSDLEINLAAHETGTRLDLVQSVAKDAPISIHYGDMEGSHLHELWEYACGLLKTYLEFGEAKCRLADSLANERKRIDHEMKIPATPEQVFAALTEPEQIKKWNAFAKDPICENKVGGRYSFGWGSGPEVNDGSQEIVHYEQDRKLSYTWVGSEKDSVVSWSIEPLPGSPRATRLTLTHSGFSDAEDITIGHNLGWGAFLHALAFAVCRDVQAGSWGGAVGEAPACQ